jgi:aminoglycoside phosphotransferase (APT) family kinase protein
MADIQQPAALDIDSPALRINLQDFLSAQWLMPVVISQLRRFPAGMSWITIGFSATLGDPAQPVETRELILRIGDPGGLLSPYSAAPEYYSLTALAGIADLPIPKAYAFSDDPCIIGAPFIVTQRVEGDTPQPWKDANAKRDEAATRSLGADFADAIGAIHAFDWAQSDLAKLSRNIAPADVALMETQYWAEHAGAPEHRLSPQLHYAMRWLQQNAPVADHITVVHGDYRVGNFLQVNGRITAILDWELVHLGDPHEDIAWAGLRTFAGGTTKIGGLIERDEFYARYQTRTGFTIRPEVVRYYEVLVQFKMAAMLVGAVQRIQSGRARDVRMAAMGFQLAPTMLELNRLIGTAA